MTFRFNYLRKSEFDFDNVRYVDFGCTGIYDAREPQSDCPKTVASHFQRESIRRNPLSAVDFPSGRNR